MKIQVLIASALCISAFMSVNSVYAQTCSDEQMALSKEIKARYIKYGKEFKVEQDQERKARAERNGPTAAFYGRVAVQAAAECAASFFSGALRGSQMFQALASPMSVGFHEFLGVGGVLLVSKATPTSRDDNWARKVADQTLFGIILQNRALYNYLAQSSSKFEQERSAEISSFEAQDNHDLNNLMSNQSMTVSDGRGALTNLDNMETVIENHIAAIRASRMQYLQPHLDKLSSDLKKNHMIRAYEARISEYEHKLRGQFLSEARDLMWNNRSSSRFVCSTQGSTLESHGLGTR